ncbi:MAG: hypothetical protein BJ554DRAFT_1658 [Olpidium bornovanus]|uniref:Zinc finger C2H2 LYAR-type domain-containing protein n=1 Tax=Olpidium bornovanus TaxID=278681 RepID=A0A8H7ZRY8_9FUNG|nr:MAG: hypothetical protein BJ554DRAFT_1658 [Olpidium bornovanus]
MVSFVCDVAKLDQHKGRCHGASFSCIDCGTSFKGAEHRAHTSCISEAEKVLRPAVIRKSRFDRVEITP